MIKLKGISKYYVSGHDQVVAGISDFSATFNVGEFVAITGPSGSGKTTLLSILSGTESFNDGIMTVFGEETEFYGEKDWERYRKELVSIVYQDFNLIENCTVFQNVELAYDLNTSEMDFKKRNEEIKQIIDKVGLIKQTNQKVSTLSGGQKQRAAIARALAKKTPLILADEPTGNLDSISAGEIVSLLKEISEEKIVIVVTHSIEDFKSCITREIELMDGKCNFDKTEKAVKPQGALTFVQVQPQEKTMLKNLVKSDFVHSKNANVLFIVVATVIMLLALSFVSIIFEATRPYENIFTEAPVFGDIEKNKIIACKKDKSIFSAQDIDKIKSNKYVSYINEYDLLSGLRARVELFNQNETTGKIDKTQLFYASNTLSNNVILSAGRMPTAINEVVVETETGAPLGAINVINEQITAVEFVDVDYKREGIKIVGYARAKKTMKQNIYFTEDFAKYVYKSYLDRYSSITFENEEKNIVFKERLALIVDDRIASDVLYVPNNIKLALANQDVKYGVKINNNLFSNAISDISVYPISDMNEDILKKYHVYSDEAKCVILNMDTLNKLVLDDVYQLSVYLNNENDYKKAIATLEDDYLVLYPHAINLVNKQEANNSRIGFVTLLSVGAIAIMLGASLVIIKSAFKYKSKVNAILYSLGYAKNTVKNANRILLSIMLGVAVAINAFILAVINIINKVALASLENIYMPLTNIPMSTLFVVVLVIVAFYFVFVGLMLNKSKKESINQVLKRGGV